MPTSDPATRTAITDILCPPDPTAGGPPSAGTPDAGTAHVELPEDWLQGRSIYGGLVAAVALRAACNQAPGRRPRSLLISFVGPVSPGTVETRAEILRQGRSVTQVDVKVLQEGTVCCAMLASLTLPRDSTIDLPGPPPPAAAAPEDLPEMPYLPGITPVCTQHFAFRWASGNMPFTGSEPGETVGWCHLRDHDLPADAELLTILVDAWPPTVLSTLCERAPASSLSWTLEFPDPPPTISLSDWWLYRATTDRAVDGYTHARAALWSADGRLVALSRQTVAVFA